jgi:hypothetical protein
MPKRKPQFAVNTSVSVPKSKMEIEETLTRYGARGFMSGWKEDVAVIAFQIEHRQIRMHLSLPARTDRQFTHTDTGRRRTPASAKEAYEQGCRQRWRALNLVIKAKLEAVTCGITTFEEEFLAHIVAGEKGLTVGEQIMPMLNSDSGKSPELRLM